MLSFSHPWYLLLLLALPPAAWWSLRRRRAAAPHPDLSLFAGLPVGRSRLAQYGGLGLRLAALALLAVALAGPRWPDLRTRIEPEGVAVFMVVDASRSMNEPDFDWNGAPMTRLDAVKRVFELFVAGSPGDQPLPDGSRARFEGRSSDLVGLVAFASRPEVVCPLTLNHATLVRLLRQQQPRAGADDAQTNISDALALALERIRTAAPPRKVLVLLTDGEHNVERPRSRWSPRQAARIAASLGVPVYTIDAGSLIMEGLPPSEQLKARAAREAAVATMEDIARMTGGRHFAARDSAALVRALREIDRMERAPITSFQYRRYHEGYPWCALAAFVFFVLAVALERTVWRRLP
jgi:Ca-activated chloride channel family protein